MFSPLRLRGPALLLACVPLGPAGAFEASAQDTSARALQTAAEFMLARAGMDGPGQALVIDTARVADEPSAGAFMDQLAAVAEHFGARLGSVRETLRRIEVTPENFGYSCHLADAALAVLVLREPTRKEDGWTVDATIWRHAGFGEEGRPRRPSVVAYDRTVILEGSEPGPWTPRFGNVAGVGHCW